MSFKLDYNPKYLTILSSGKSFTFNLLTADIQQWFGVEAHCGHSGDHVLGIGDAELVCH